MVHRLSTTGANVTYLLRTSRGWLGRTCAGRSQRTARRVSKFLDPNSKGPGLTFKMFANPYPNFRHLSLTIYLLFSLRVTSRHWAISFSVAHWCIRGSFDVVGESLPSGRKVGSKGMKVRVCHGRFHCTLVYKFITRNNVVAR